MWLFICFIFTIISPVYVWTIPFILCVRYPLVLQWNHGPVVVRSFVYHKEENTSRHQMKLHYGWIRTKVKVSLGGEEEAEPKGFFLCCLLARKLLPTKEIVSSTFSRISTLCSLFIDSKALMELKSLWIFMFIASGCLLLCWILVFGDLKLKSRRKFPEQPKRGVSWGWFSFYCNTKIAKSFVKQKINDVCWCLCILYSWPELWCFWSGEGCRFHGIGWSSEDLAVNTLWCSPCWMGTMSWDSSRGNVPW